MKVCCMVKCTFFEYYYMKVNREKTRLVKHDYYGI